MKKKLLSLLLLAIFLVPGLVWAGSPVIYGGIDSSAIGGPITVTSVTISGNTYFATTVAVSDEGAVTLPTVTANYSGHGFVRVSAAGVIADSAEFEVGSDGNVSLIRGTANVVVGVACADTKICISTAAAQNPVVVQARNGAGQIEIEFWYH